MELHIVILNLLYATAGAVLVITGMLLGYKVLDKITKFNTSDQLEQGNIAVGIVVGSMMVGLGLAVGLVIGLGLN